MKFFLSLNLTYLNIDEIVKVEHESDKHIYSYFYMKNGEKFDVFDMPDFFNVDDEKEYVCCELCHVVMNGIILRHLMEDYPTEHLYNIDSSQDDLWEDFIYWSRNNLNKLTEKKRKL